MAGDEDAVAASRAAGLAVTAPRRAVYGVLAGWERPVSAADVYDLLRASGSRLGLTSVYRVLHSFAASGIVHVFPGDLQRFRICDRMPHAHLVSEECGRVMERPADTVRQWLALAARGRGLPAQRRAQRRLRTVRQVPPGSRVVVGGGRRHAGRSGDPPRHELTTLMKMGIKTVDRMSLTERHHS